MAHPASGGHLGFAARDSEDPCHRPRATLCCEVGPQEAIFLSWRVVEPVRLRGPRQSKGDKCRPAGQVSSSRRVMKGEEPCGGWVVAGFFRLQKDCGSWSGHHRRGLVYIYIYSSSALWFLCMLCKDAVCCNSGWEHITVGTARQPLARL